MSRRFRQALSRGAIIGILVVVIIIVIAAAYAVNASISSTTVSTTTSTSSSPTSLTSTLSSSSASTISSSISSISSSSTSQALSSSTSSTSFSSSSSSANSTLTIDADIWPLSGSINELYAISGTNSWCWLCWTVYEPLVQVNVVAEYQNGNIQYTPGLATNWTVSSDGTVYTFSLRPNVTFSDGNPFNAYQVWMQMYGFYYLSGNASAWLVNYNLFNMGNVTFGPATVALINQSGLISPSQTAKNIMMNSSWPIYVTNQNQIVFHLKSPFVWFPSVLVAFDGLMYDAQYLLDHGGFGTPTAFNPYFNSNPLPGTGPYMVTSVSQNAYVIFTQNPNYWGRNLSAAEIAAQPFFSPGTVKNVIVNLKTDDLVRYTDLSSGASQMSSIQGSDWNLVANNPEYSYFKLPPWTGEVAFLGLNTKIYPTNITAVRQAIVHAINYTDLINKAYLGQMTPYVGPEYPAWSQFYDLGNLTPYQYNLTLAKQDLSQANITNMPTFTYDTFSGCQPCVNVGQVVQSDLAAIGLTVNIQVTTESTYYAPYGSYTTNVQNAQQIGQLSSILGGQVWAPFALNPADYWVSFVSNGSLYGNWAIYSNPVVQKCVNAFTSSANSTFIQGLCKAAQAQIYNDAPYAWIGLNRLWNPSGGSIVWKSNVIKSFLVEPLFTGQDDLPIFQTVVLG